MSLRTGVVVALLALGLSIGLAGCGVRGALKAPPDAQATGTATSAEDGDPGENSAAPPKKHRPFVLDGLL